MPVSYNIEHSALTFITVGDVEYSQGLAVLTEGLERYTTTKPALPRVMFDLIQSTENRRSDELQGIAEIVTGKLPGARIALVAQSNLHFGLSRVFSALAERKTSAINVFRDLEEARSWLMAE